MHFDKNSHGTSITFFLSAPRQIGMWLGIDFEQ